MREVPARLFADDAEAAAYLLGLPMIALAASGSLIVWVLRVPTALLIPFVGAIGFGIGMVNALGFVVERRAGVSAFEACVLHPSVWWFMRPQSLRTAVMMTRGRRRAALRPLLRQRRDWVLLSGLLSVLLMIAAVLP